jgi:hypothetical protein
MKSFYVIVRISFYADLHKKSAEISINAVFDESSVLWIDKEKTG